MPADLPHLLRPRSLEDSKAQKLSGKSLRYVLAEHDVEPWLATTLIRETLEKQAWLKANSPLLLHLQYVPVVAGLKYFKSKLDGTRDLDQDAFVNIASNLLVTEMCARDDKIITSDVTSVFDFMDSHASKRLSIGEWAGALTVFFAGTQEEKARALFDLLDEHSKGWLSNEELQQYLIAPVKAMTPLEASPLLPALLRLCADQIMDSASFTDKNKMSCQDFIQWQSKSNNVKGRISVPKKSNLIDCLSKTVEAEVHRAYLQSQQMLAL